MIGEKAPKLELPPMQYQLQYDWGTFSVSELAHEAYGLMPLRTEEEPKDTEPLIPNYRDYKVDALLVVPGEMEVPDVPPMDMYANHSWKKNRLTVVSAVGGTADSLKDVMVGDILHFIADTNDIDDVDELRKHVLDGEGVPLDESIGHNMPQMIIHFLSANVGKEVSEAILDKEETRLQRTVLRGAKLVGAFGLASSGFILSEPLYPEPKPSPLDTAVALGIFLTAYSVYSYSLLKTYLKHQDRRENLIDFASTAQGVKVGHDLHDSFCRHHFDEQIEDLTS